jgi:hypothetical protein
VPLTNPFEIVGMRRPRNVTLRVSAFIANPPEVDIRIPAEGMPEVILFGVPEHSYRLETRTALGTAEPWQNGPSVTMTNSFFIHPVATTDDDAMRFFRAREL